MNLRSLFRSFSTLQIALGVSVAVHAALLSVRFIDPEGFNRVFQDTPLEVILVNAKSTERPEKAQAIAQSNLAGGGDAAQGRATSPLPYSALTAVGDDFEEMQRKMDAMQEQQTQLLTQLRKQLAAMPEPDPRKQSDSGEQMSQEEKRRQLLKLLNHVFRHNATHRAYRADFSYRPTNRLPALSIPVRTQYPRPRRRCIRETLFYRRNGCRLHWRR